MRLTKNTNKSVRAWVDGILSQLNLVKGDENYREHYETLTRCKHQMAWGNATKADVIETMRSVCGCVTPGEVEHAQRLSCNGALDNFLNQL